MARAMSLGLVGILGVGLTGVRCLGLLSCSFFDLSLGLGGLGLFNRGVLCFRLLDRGLVGSLDVLDRSPRTRLLGQASTAACGAAAAATGAAFLLAAVRRARLASDVTVFSRTSSMTAIGALSPWRASTLMMRV